jgi:ring-1,2-phenylacetyl-CoA epoxidase subunit PaaE
MTPRFHRLRIKDILRETEDTVSVSFEVPTELKEDYLFEAGQHLTFKMNSNGEEIRRSYSICKAPHEKELRVAIKKVQEGLFSTFANEKLVVGEELEVMTPMGKFTVEFNKKNQKSYLFFASGSGITPVISLIKTILAEEPLSNVSLVYGNKGVAHIIFRDELEGLKNQFMNRFNLIHILSRENLGITVQKGRISGDKCTELFNTYLKNQAIDEVFICGPEEMIHAVKDFMLAKGVDKKSIHFELFNTSEIKKVNSTKEDPKVEANVQIILDGDTFEIVVDSHGDSILDAAYKSGADVPFACKGGVCCTCKAKIIEGSVKMDVNYGLEEDEVAAGYILTCQSHPTSEKLTVSFDD